MMGSYFPHSPMWYDDDEDDDKKNDDQQVPEPGGETGNYNLGDDIGTLIGEGSDSQVDPI